MKKKFLESFTKKTCKKQVKQSLELKKQLREKVINCMSNGKAVIYFLTVRLIKKISLSKISYFLEPYTRSKNKMKVELDLSNYAKKSDLKNSTGVDTSQFAKKADLASLKSVIDKLDIDELEKLPSILNSLKSKVDALVVGKVKPVPKDLKQLSDVLDKECLKKIKI